MLHLRWVRPLLHLPPVISQGAPTSLIMLSGRQKRWALMWKAAQRQLYIHTSHDNVTPLLPWYSHLPLRGSASNILKGKMSRRSKRWEVTAHMHLGVLTNLKKSEKLCPVPLSWRSLRSFSESEANCSSVVFASTSSCSDFLFFTLPSFSLIKPCIMSVLPIGFWGRGTARIGSGLCKHRWLYEYTFMSF